VAPVGVFINGAFRGNEVKALKAEGEIMMDPWIGAKGE
jgi:hypothetical protein